MFGATRPLVFICQDYRRLDEHATFTKKGKVTRIMTTIIANSNMSGNIALLQQALPEWSKDIVDPKINNSNIDYIHPTSQLVVCVPAVYLMAANDLLQSYDRYLQDLIKLGCQDRHQKQNGTFTNERSPSQLAEVGCTDVLLGHSEKALHHYEDNKTVKEKAEAAMQAGVAHVICVGNDFNRKQSGNTLDVIWRQLEEASPASEESETPE